MCLLGAPSFPGTRLNEMLQHKLEEFESLSTNLRSIDAHDVLLIIKFSLNSSRVMHLLRCSPCCGHPLLKELDNLQRSNICHFFFIIRLLGRKYCCFQCFGFANINWKRAVKLCYGQIFGKSNIRVITISRDTFSPEQQMIQNVSKN